MTAVGGGSAAPGDVASEPGSKPRRSVTIVAWVLQVLLGLAMLGAGATKLAGQPAMVQLFDDIGSGQWMRYLVGVLEVAGGVGLLVPRVRAWAALGVLLLMLAATVTNLAILQVDTTFSVVYALMAAAILLLRRRELVVPRR